MKTKLSTAFILFLINFLNAQIIFGTVINSTEKPLSAVTIYIDGTKISTKSNEEGDFTLNSGALKNVNLIFSLDGYATISYPLEKLINKKAKVILERESQIKEVVLIPFTDKNFENDFSKFKYNFLGNDDGTIIKNKRELHFATLKKENIFLAKAKKPLIIENKSLGYIITYNLYEFELKEFELRFLGSSYFTEMKGSKRQKKIWEENRKNAYYGSLTNFIRSLYEGKIKEHNFIVHKARKVVNPKYPTATELDKLNSYYKTFLDKNILKLDTMPAEIKDISDRKSKNSPLLLQIYEKNISENSYLKIENKEKFLDFDDLLMVVITINGRTIDSLLNANGNEFTIYKEGNLSNPDLLILEGDWSKDKIDKMLPLDYEP